MILRRKDAWLALLIVFLLNYPLKNSFSKELSKTESADKIYDVCIYGSTSAGVIAAYSAQKLGKSVIIISPDGHIGGLSSGGLGQTDIGNKHVISGLARDFYRKLGKEYTTFESWTFEPGRARKLFEDYLKESNVAVIKHKRIEKAVKEGAKIVSVNLVPTYGKTTERQEIKAKVFLDCTYEGDLLHLAGISYTVGREANSVYNETISGYFLAEYKTKSGYHQFPDGVSPYKIPGNAASGLVWGISHAKEQPQGSGDKRVQAYNFRICLTDSVENRLPITKPADYDANKYELMARLFKAQPDMLDINNYFIWSPMPNRKTDVNNRGGFSTDMIGWSDKWPEASFEERKKLFEAHVSYTKGMLYFMQNDARVPDKLQKFIRNWGYPKDEYVEDGNFSPQLYVREGRRMVGEYVMTEKNCVGKEVVKDGIGMAAYTMDSHNCQRIVVNGMVKNEGNVEVGGFPPFPISYRSLVPKKKECSNLLVPVSLSASHIAFGSIRMEPVFMVLGQAAAVAAVMAIDSKVAVQDVSVADLQKKLKDDPYVNGGLRDVLIDDNDRDRLELKGQWDKKFFNHASYSSSTVLSSDSGAQAVFKINVPKNGRYKLYYYCTGIKELKEANDYVFELKHESGFSSKNILANKKPGTWQVIDSVELTSAKEYQLNLKAGKGTAVLVVDALLVVPEKLGYVD